MQSEDAEQFHVSCLCCDSILMSFANNLFFYPKCLDHSYL